MKYEDKSESRIVDVEGMDVTAGFEWSVGKLMDNFITQLGNKKIIGSRCPDCDYTHVPPRSRCVECFSKMGENELIELSDEGTLLSYTVAQVEINDKEGTLDALEEPIVIGIIKLEDADSKIFMPIKGIDMEEIEEGMSVQASWREETKEKIEDLQYFKPLEEGE